MSKVLRRYLVEDGHRWSETVKHLIDVRPNCSERLGGKDEQGKDKHALCKTSMVIYFFPRGADKAKKLESSAKVAVTS